MDVIGWLRDFGRPTDANLAVQRCPYGDAISRFSVPPELAGAPPGRLRGSELYFTLAEAAAELLLPVGTVRRLLKQGGLPRVRLHGREVVHRDVLPRLEELAYAEAARRSGHPVEPE